MPKRDEHAIKNWREKWVIYFSFRAIFVWCIFQIIRARFSLSSHKIESYSRMY